MIISKPPSLTTSLSDMEGPKKMLIEHLLANRISSNGLLQLRSMINSDDLSDIIQHIYDLNEKYILQISKVEGLMRIFDDIKNQRRNNLFTKKMKSGFRGKSPNNKVILAEGDSWFNYPIILTDIIDRISMEKNFAVYSLASGGDWLLNMLTGRHYVEELSILHPDVFLISGGGNDLVGSRRLAAVLESKPGDEYLHSSWAQQLIENADGKFIPLNRDDFNEGVRYLSKDFFALLMFFHLQYYSLIHGILKSGKFLNIQIITQGYDYPIPSSKIGGLKIWRWYIPFVRKFLGHSSWLSTPMKIRGITNEDLQRKILYSIIYLFNEMAIQLGASINEEFPDSVFHIDSRGSVGNGGWTDELHARPEHFLRTGEVFANCINKSTKPDYAHTYIVGKMKSEK
ncbi:MAG TPA: hypothetical protein VKT28_19385 [Puia sp.]|nr:hypothetical protein [Puia sp.]